jgi:hypothetical protein
MAVTEATRFGADFYSRVSRKGSNAVPSVTSTLSDALAQTLCELGRVDRLAALGTNGPLLASAGAHSLFHCLFGRDALRMADDLLADFPRLGRAT